MPSDRPGASFAPETTPLLAGGRWRVLLFCWLGWVFDLYDLLLFSFTKGHVAADLGLDLFGAIAWIEGFSLLATALGGFAFGRLADRVGRRQAMVLGIATFSSGALATGLAHGFWSLLLARAVTGLGAGGEWGIGHAVVAERWAGPARDRVHGLLQAGSPVAMALAAAVGCFLVPLPAVGWRTAFLASAGLGVLAFAGRWALPGPSAPPAERLPARLLLAPAYARRTVVLLAVLTLHMAGFWCVYAELPVQLVRMHGVGVAEVGWFQLQVNGVHVVADISFGWLAARCGQRRVFVAFCLLFALGQTIVLQRLPTLQGDFAHFTAAVALMGLGAGTWSSFGALFGQHYPAALRATAAATCYAVARGVQLPLKPLVGAAFERAGSFAPALWIGIAGALGSALCIALLPRPPAQPSAAATLARNSSFQR